MEKAVRSTSSSACSLVEAAAAVSNAAASGSSAAARLSMEAARGSRERGGRRRGRVGRRIGSAASAASTSIVDLCDSSVGEADQSVVVCGEEDQEVEEGSSDDFSDCSDSGDEYRPEETTSSSFHRPEAAMNTDAVTKRMASMFRNSLQLHAKGHHMQVC